MMRLFNGFLFLILNRKSMPQDALLFDGDNGVLLFDGDNAPLTLG